MNENGNKVSEYETRSTSTTLSDSEDIFCGEIFDGTFIPITRPCSDIMTSLYVLLIL
jgi:hypothetical protein